MNAFVKFNKAAMKMPLPWRLWLLLLISFNLVIPLFFISRLEAQVVVAALMLSVALMTILTGRYGFTRILGLGHIFWRPMIFFLLTRFGDIPADTFFGIWIRLLITMNIASLVLDGTDVARYFAGDHKETVPGLC